MRSIRPTFPIAFLALVLAACSGNPTGPRSLTGVWSGYLGMGENISGETVMTIAADRSCSLEAELDGDLPGWGPFTLRMEGELLIYNRAVSGPVTITRYRAGIDTVETPGFWSGQFFFDTNAASGGWMTFSEGVFFAQGRWGAMKR